MSENIPTGQNMEFMETGRSVESDGAPPRQELGDKCEANKPPAPMTVETGAGLGENKLMGSMETGDVPRYQSSSTGLIAGSQGPIDAIGGGERAYGLHEAQVGDAPAGSVKVGGSISGSADRGAGGHRTGNVHGASGNPLTGEGYTDDNTHSQRRQFYYSKRTSLW